MNHDNTVIEAVHQERLQHTIEVLHHASQWLALWGKWYVPPAPDDSHTTSIWHHNSTAQWSQPLPSGFRLSLNLSTFSLEVVSPDGTISTAWPLHLTEKSETMHWLQGILSDIGMDSARFKWDLHYDLPLFPYDDGIPYRKPAGNLLRSYCQQRSVTQQVWASLQHADYGVGPAYIWPHHFDTGWLLKEKSLTIGMGWAVPDQLSAWPYWYAKGYTKDPQKEQSSLTYGTWHSDFEGYILPVNTIWDTPDGVPLQQTLTFFEESIASLRS